MDGWLVFPDAPAFRDNWWETLPEWALSGQEVTIRMENRDRSPGRPRQGQFEDARGEDTEGHTARVRWGGHEGEDAEGHGTARGVPLAGAALASREAHSARLTQ
jgi:hypothetical protein